MTIENFGPHEFELFLQNIKNMIVQLHWAQLLTFNTFKMVKALYKLSI